MTFDRGAPCRHRGAPPESVVRLVVRLLETELGAEKDVLRRHGLSVDEYQAGFPAAIEALRGRWAASNRVRRNFVELIVQHLARTKLVKAYDVPEYGADTVYRLTLGDGKRVGLIQKGCPDGAHSSTNWKRPNWADELYLWWVCSSLNHQPGEHVWKGVKRLMRKVSVDPKNQLDGLVFFSPECGTADRPCPKMARAIDIDGVSVPPPCIYVFPQWETTTSNLNWHGHQTRLFPSVVFAAFAIDAKESTDFTGYVGFRGANSSAVRTEITSRFGPGKSTTARG